MINKIWILLASVVIFNSANSQIKDTVIVSIQYKFIHLMDTTQPNDPLKENMILYLGKNLSKYTSYDVIVRKSKIKVLGGPVGASNAISENGRLNSGNRSGGDVASGSASPMLELIWASNTYYKDEPLFKLTYLTFANGKLFSLEEKIPVIDWDITQETKVIKGYNCQKAKGKFKGRIYEAWFCNKLPYRNGPWKLGGLPGLILEAYDAKKEVQFLFSSFNEHNELNTTISIPENAIKTSYKEFTKYQKAVEKDRDAMKGNSSVGGSGMGGLMKIDGAITSENGQILKILKLNNPIEKQ